MVAGPGDAERLADVDVLDELIDVGDVAVVVQVLGKLAEDLVLRGALEVQVDNVLGKNFVQFHGVWPFVFVSYAALRAPALGSASHHNVIRHFRKSK